MWHDAPRRDFQPDDAERRSFQSDDAERRATLTCRFLQAF